MDTVQDKIIHAIEDHENFTPYYHLNHGDGLRSTSWTGECYSTADWAEGIDWLHGKQPRYHLNKLDYGYKRVVFLGHYSYNGKRWDLHLTKEYDDGTNMQYVTAVSELGDKQRWGAEDSRDYSDRLDRMFQVMWHRAKALGLVK